MKKSRLLGVVCLLLLPATQPAAAADQYLCITDKATGFYFEDGEWNTANFKTGRKFLIRKPNKEELEVTIANIGRDFVVSEFGDKSTLLWCDEDFYCVGHVDDFLFDKKTLRFLYIYKGGYVSGIDNNDNTPAMQIGTCSPLP